MPKKTDDFNVHVIEEQAKAKIQVRLYHVIASLFVIHFLFIHYMFWSHPEVEFWKTQMLQVSAFIMGVMSPILSGKKEA